MKIDNLTYSILVILNINAFYSTPIENNYLLETVHLNDGIINKEVEVQNLINPIIPDGNNDELKGPLNKKMFDEFKLVGLDQNDTDGECGILRGGNSINGNGGFGCCEGGHSYYQTGGDSCCIGGNSRKGKGGNSCCCGGSSIKKDNGNSLYKFGSKYDGCGLFRGSENGSFFCLNYYLKGTGIDVFFKGVGVGRRLEWKGYRRRLTRRSIENN